ncbi:hypothetical protein GBA52_028618 [Prunus armeniaca]|nr:hypothetical protein GBA52_028618 [Prunus armeniaca]
MIDEELINTIISEYGTADCDLLEKKTEEIENIRKMLICLPHLRIYFVKPKESSVVVPSEELEDSKDEEDESVDEDDESVDEDDESVAEDDESVDEEDESVDEENAPEKKCDEDKKKKVLVEPPPKLVRMGKSLCCGWSCNNNDLQTQWREAKRSNKLKVVSLIKERTGYSVNPDAMFDIQRPGNGEEKFFSEREKLVMLNSVMGCKLEGKQSLFHRVCMFGGKAFSTYVQAKRIVKFITDVAATINRDPGIGDLLKVVFAPDYNVSVAELLIPASELSQHISTAGMEASGTSNMKFAMNGCILIGTLDGANVEIREEVGADNFFLFGAKAHEIAGLRKERAEGRFFVPDPRFEEVKEFIRSGVFGSFNYDELIGSLEGNEGFGRADYFLVGKDFPSYIECQEKVDEAYRDQKRWTRMSILNTAGSYKFSSDRTIHEYAKDIWNINPVELP